MKNFILLFVLMSTPLVSLAGGFDCPSLNKKLELIKSESGEYYFVDPKISIQMGADIDSYQDRWFTYNLLIEQATIRFPYMPGALLVFHVMRSNKLFHAGFKQVDDPNSTTYVKLPKMYCKALIKAIEEY